MRMGIVLGDLGEGEDIGGSEVGADPGEEWEGLLNLERPLEAIRAQRLVPLQP